MKESVVRRTAPVKALRRYRFIFPPKNKYCLMGIKRHPRNWRLVVLTLCRIYNCFHATKNKCCSIDTSLERKEFYLEFFRYVSKELKIDPRQLKSKHVEAYFHHKIAEHLNQGTEPKVIAKKIRNEVSHLKFFSWWISKPNAVPKFSKIMKAERFRLENCPMSNFRNSHTEPDSLVRKISDAFKISKLLGLQVSVMAHFGLRPAESVCLDYEDCFLTENGRPYIHVKEGSKGGKPRKIFAKTASQYEVFSHISAYCIEHDIRLFRDPELSPKQALKLQSKQLVDRLGVSKELFEGSAYSMRHSFAARRMNDSATDLQRTSLEVSEDLGHHRGEITAVYVGNLERAGKDLLPGLLSSLAADPTHIKTEDRLKMFFRELLASHTFLAYSLLFWCAYSEEDGADLEALAVRKQAFFGKKRSLHTEEILLEKLSLITERSTAKSFLTHFNQSCPVEWIEKNVMASFDANLFFK